jgi:hypothetical protein
MSKSRLIVGSAAALLIALPELHATPLDAEACTKLNGERLQLEFGGVRANMAKGPEWAKANLGAEALGQIRRFLEVEAQLLFRCQGSSLVNLPTESDPDPPAASRDEGEDGKGAPAKAATPPPAADKKPNPAKKAAVPPAPPKAAPATQAKQDPGRPAPGKAATAKPPAKADDAYKPPPVDPKVNPFAGQVQPATK